MRELPLLNIAIGELASGQLLVRDHKIFSKGLVQDSGVDLTETIEDFIFRNM
jgi:hypothetical protein